MSSYGEYCPLARGSEIFANRWTPIIMRNLLLGCRTFGEIREGAPGIPKSLLSQRLKLLEHHGIVEREGSDYVLTESGRAIEPVLDSLTMWGAVYLDRSPTELDSSIVLWALCRHLNRNADLLPADSLTIRFDLPGAPYPRLWVLADPAAAEVCKVPPKTDDDGVLKTDPERLLRWYNGGITLGHALHEGLAEYDGPPAIERLLARWGGLGATYSKAEPVPA